MKEEEKKLIETLSIVLPFLPLKLQSKMADPLIRAFKDDISLNELVIDIERNFNNFKDRNDACFTIANVAYIAVNTDDAELKSKCENIIKRYKTHITAKIYKILDKIDNDINKIPKEFIKEKFFQTVSKLSKNAT